MATCRYAASCFFYNDYTGNMPKTAAYIRDKYCNKNVSFCARFKASQSVGIDNVPRELFPLGYGSVSGLDPTRGLRRQ